MPGPNGLRAGGSGVARCRCGKAVAAAGACQRVVPGTSAHTKGVTGRPITTTRRAGGSTSPPARLRRDQGTATENRRAGTPGRFAESILGCAAGNDERFRLGEGRYRYNVGNLNWGIQRARRVLCAWAGWCASRGGFWLETSLWLTLAMEKGLGRAIEPPAGEKDLGFREVAPLKQRPH